MKRQKTVVQSRTPRPVGRGVATSIVRTFAVTRVVRSGLGLVRPLGIAKGSLHEEEGFSYRVEGVSVQDFRRVVEVR